MRCDSESATFTSMRFTSASNKTHQMALHMCCHKLYQSIAGHNHHVYCDNYFTSIPMLKQLLQMKIYASGTVRSNKKGLPAEVKKPPPMLKGQHRSFQEPNSNLVPKVWHDNRPVRVLSTNSRPDITIPIERHCRNVTIAVDQPENCLCVQKTHERS